MTIGLVEKHIGHLNVMHILLLETPIIVQIDRLLEEAVLHLHIRTYMLRLRTVAMNDPEAKQIDIVPEARPFEVEMSEGTIEGGQDLLFLLLLAATRQGGICLSDHHNELDDSLGLL